jgi:molecular chaperone GrpE
MSRADESSIDALVGEVMSRRAAAEAAGAPAPAAAVAPPQMEPPVEKSSMTIGFADPIEQKGSGDPVANIDSLVDDAADVDIEGDAAPDTDERADADLSETEQLRLERDTYLADSQRLAAEFANHRKQSEKRVAETAASQSAGLVRSLLPVLDACDSAIDLEPDSSVVPIRRALIGELERNGLELLAPAVGDSFDPEQHEAVMHEEASADGGQNGPEIGEVFRAGYLWKGRVVRPAMVKVVG